MSSITFSKKIYKYIGITIIWLAIWEVASLFVDNSILLVGPIEVIKTLVYKLADMSFYKSIGLSMLKIGAGFLMGTLGGILLAAISAKYSLVEDFFKPLMSFMKAAPVASFVVLFLIWWHSNVLSIAICICVVLPQIYVSTFQGLKSTDRRLLQMADIYRVHPMDRFHYIYLPAVYDYLQSAVKISAGMAWKSGVAAEVIGTPEFSIGNELYMSKIYLDTAAVLSWTLVIIIISILCEKILLLLLRKYKEHDFKCYGSTNSVSLMTHPDLLKITGLSKAYGDHVVLDKYSHIYEKNKPETIRWASGAGKTTLFNIIAGSLAQDEGTIDPERYIVSYAFQDDRLIEGATALKNVELVNPKRAEEILKSLLNEDEMYRSVDQLSGGQRHRVSVAMACALDADVALFDEPYKGLDDTARKRVSELIREYSMDRIVIIASHI